MAADPAVTDGTAVEDFAGRQHRVAKRQPRDFARLGGTDAEDGSDAPFSLATTPSQDMERESGDQPSETDAHAIRQNTEESLKYEDSSVFYAILE